VDLPPGIDLAVYRIAQEAMTNVLKHAPGAPTVVQVVEGADSVTVTVTNSRGRQPELRPPVGAGHGLLGSGRGSRSTEAA
jgi:signal transduction histidine kinase